MSYISVGTLVHYFCVTMHLLKSLDYLLPDGLQKNGRVMITKCCEMAKLAEEMKQNASEKAMKTTQDDTHTHTEL